MDPKHLRIDNLLVLCKSGNRQAQMELYDRYFDAMYYTAKRIVRNTEMAEDLVQEGFIKAFEKIHTLQQPQFFGAWLKRIIVNNCLTACRESSRSVEIVTDKDLPEAFDADAAAENAEGLSEQTQRLMQAMGRLHENYRMVLTLHFLEGYPQEEVADLMGISHGNCRTMLSRAKESLKKLLN